MTPVPKKTKSHSKRAGLTWSVARMKNEINSKTPHLTQKTLFMLAALAEVLAGEILVASISAAQKQGPNCMVNEVHIMDGVNANNELHQLYADAYYVAAPPSKKRKHKAEEVIKKPKTGPVSSKA